MSTETHIFADNLAAPFRDNLGQVAAFCGIYNFISRWQRENFRNNKIIKLEAPAGRGKTYVARLVMNAISKEFIKVTAMAFTGRAVKQLSKAGIQAKTFHSILYAPVLDTDGNLIKFQKRTIDEIRADVGQAVLVDEGSMVPSKIAKILLSLRLPIIVMGDSEQLESIEDDNQKYNMLDEPMMNEFHLDQNVRFSEDSGIGRISEHLRHTNSFPHMVGDDIKMIRRPKVFKEEFHKNNKFDLIICGTNKTRKTMNNLVRRARGYYDPHCEDELPTIGEQIVCLKNTVVNGVYITNGELFTVKRISPVNETISQLAITSIDDNTTVNVLVENGCWLSCRSENKAHKDIPLCTFTHGYALTCHKVQGSTIPRPLFIDEDVSYFLDQKKYRYTGVSRASKHITIAK